MVRRPAHLGREILRVAGCEVQPDNAVLHDLRHGAQARSDDRKAPAEGLGKGHRKALIPIRRHDEERGASHLLVHRRGRQFAEGHDVRRSRTLRHTQQRAIAGDAQRHVEIAPRRQ